MKLDKSFYERDTIEVAQSLLGCLLVSEIGGKNKRTSGIIVETEAYSGEKDPASHAFKGMTRRNQIMYGEAGRAYVYLIYGKHHLLNVVTEKAGSPGAVLIRALKPVDGCETMKERRGSSTSASLTSGPGKLTQALGITINHYGLDMTSTIVWIEKYTHYAYVQSSPRIGVKDMTPLRFYIKNTHL